MDKLEIDGQLLSGVTDNQNPDSRTALSKSMPHLVMQIALINTFQPLLDFTCLGHANESSIITDINEPVLLEDWS